MLEKKKPRSGRRKLQITIYPKTGQSSGKTTFKKKKRYRRQTEVSSIGTNLPMQAEMLLIKLAKSHQK